MNKHFCHQNTNILIFNVSFALLSIRDLFSSYVPDIIMRRLSTTDLSSSIAEVRTVATVFVELKLSDTGLLVIRFC